MIKVLGKEKLLRGRNLGVDATSLEANAAMRSIVRRGTGQSDEKFLDDLAQSAGMEEPSRQDISKIDRNRKGKGSNKEWKSLSDPDSGIMKMKHYHPIGWQNFLDNVDLQATLFSVESPTKERANACKIDESKNDTSQFLLRKE